MQEGLAAAPIASNIGFKPTKADRYRIDNTTMANANGRCIADALNVTKSTSAKTFEIVSIKQFGTRQDAITQGGQAAVIQTAQGTSV